MKHLYSLVFVLFALTSSHLTTAQTIIPNVTFTNDNTMNCSGTASAAPTGGAGGYSFMWSNGATTSSIGNLCAGSYYVIIQDANQDTASFSFTITNPCSNLIVTPSVTDCTPGNCDGIIQLAVSGGTAPYSFTWSGAPPTGISTLSNLCPDTYTIQCTDASGCVTPTLSVTVNDTSLQATISANLTSTNDLTGNCSGSASVSPSGGTAPYYINWNFGPTTNSVNGLCTGTYSVTIWDASGTDTITVNFNIYAPCTNFTGTFSSTPTSGPALCDGSIMFYPFNGTAPYTYVWNNGMTTQTILNVCAGNYTVTCLDANGCSITATGPVVDSSSFFVNLTTVDDYSSNCTGSASVSPTGGNPPYSVAWSTGEMTNSIDSLCAGIYSVTVWYVPVFDSVTINFVIADSSSTYGNNPYPNGSINDTLYTDLVTNCIIDYNVIDSASLYQAVYSASNQSLYVTWAVYSPTDTVYISDTLALIGNPGYYSLTISVFCPNKSGNDFLKIESVIYFDGSNVWTSTLGLEEQDPLENVSVYPNPFSNSISVDNKTGVIQSLKLIDLNGRILSEMNQVNSGLVELNDLESVSSGTYLLILSGENTSKTIKVIK